MDLKKAGSQLCKGCPDKAPGCKEKCTVTLVARTPSQYREYNFQSSQVKVVTNG